MSKVKCKVCSKEEDSFCTVKKIKIRTNKPRTCGIFNFSMNKVKVKHELPATYVKGGDLKAYREEMMEKFRQQASGAKVESTADCLKDFRSTAE